MICHEVQEKRDLLIIKSKTRKIKVEMKIALSRKSIRNKVHLHDKLTLCLTLRKSK